MEAITQVTFSKKSWKENLKVTPCTYAYIINISNKNQPDIIWLLQIP